MKDNELFGLLDRKTRRSWRSLDPTTRYLRLLEAAGLPWWYRQAKLIVFQALSHQDRVWFVMDVWPTYEQDLARWYERNNNQPVTKPVYQAA